MSDPTNSVTRPALNLIPWLSKIDRKVWAGGVGGVLALAVMSACKAFIGFDIAGFLQPFLSVISTAAGVDPPLSAQAVLTLLFTVIVGYLVPAAYSDIYKRINAKVIALAVTDDTTPQLQGVTLPSIMHETMKIERAEPIPTLKSDDPRL